MLNVVRMKLIERVEDAKGHGFEANLMALETPVRKKEQSDTKTSQRGNDIKGRFQGLKDVQKRFNDKVLRIVANAYYLAKDEPKLLVCAMRIMMNEERAYEQIKELSSIEPVLSMKS